MAMRSLYDLEYLDSNCTLPYDATTEVDNSLTTAISNYTIGVVAFLAALYFIVKKSNGYWIAYLLLTAIGYTLAGVYHNSFNDTEDKGGNALYYLSVGLTILALPCLKFTLTQSKWLRIGFVVTNTAVFILLVAFFYAIVAALWSLVSFLIVGIYKACWQKQWLAAVGCWIIVAGFLVLGVLDGTCGSAAQKDCFKDCIFPDPVNFNHNGLFHFMVALGVLLQAIAEAISPTTYAASTDEEGKITERPEKSDGEVFNEEDPKASVY